MEIKKTFLIKKSIFFFIIFTSYSAIGDEVVRDFSNPSQISTNPVEFNSIAAEETSDLHELEPLRGANIDLSKIFDISNRFKATTPFEEFNPDSLESSLDVFSLQPGEYIQVTNKDNRVVLFNGSIKVTFKTSIDLKFFASSNQIELQSDLSDINAGFFKVKNILDLELIIKNLRNDENISSISLNTLDPNIKPR